MHHISHVDGIPISASNIQESGRVRVDQPVREWPEIAGLTLSDTELTKEEILSAMGLVRARVDGILYPAVRIDLVKAVKVNMFSVGKGMEFSPHGDSKEGCASFYISKKAKQISGEICDTKVEPLRSDSLEEVSNNEFWVGNAILHFG